MITCSDEKQQCLINNSNNFFNNKNYILLLYFNLCFLFIHVFKCNLFKYSDFLNFIYNGLFIVQNM